MPAHKKPTELLNNRYAKAAGRDKTLPPPPRGPLTRKPKLPKDVSACWDDLLIMAPPGVLQDCDGVIAEITARLWARARNNTASAADLTQLRACLGELGMSPAARNRVAIPAGPTSNAFADA